MAGKKQVEKKYTIREVHELKDIPLSTLKKLCKDGRIPGAELIINPVFPNGYWLIPESSLDKIELKPRGRKKKHP